MSQHILSPAWKSAGHGRRHRPGEERQAERAQTRSFAAPRFRQPASQFQEALREDARALRSQVQHGASEVDTLLDRLRRHDVRGVCRQSAEAVRKPRILPRNTPLVPACGRAHRRPLRLHARSEEHTSELQSLMRISYAVFCLKKKKTQKKTT